MVQMSHKPGPETVSACDAAVIESPNGNMGL